MGWWAFSLGLEARETQKELGGALLAPTWPLPELSAIASGTQTRGAGTEQDLGRVSNSQLLLRGALKTGFLALKGVEKGMPGF